MNRAEFHPRLNVIRECGSKDALDGRGDEARGRRKRFDGARIIQGLREFDRRFDRSKIAECCGRRKHKGNRSDQRAVGIMAARHGANHHSRHVMTAIHVIRGFGGSLLVMMRGNLALTVHAAGGLIGGPGGSR